MYDILPLEEGVHAGRGSSNENISKKYQTPPSSEQTLNPPPLSQEEEFIQTIEKQILSLLDKLIFGHIF